MVRTRSGLPLVLPVAPLLCLPWKGDIVLVRPHPHGKGQLLHQSVLSSSLSSSDNTSSDSNHRNNTISLSSTSRLNLNSRRLPQRKEAVSAFFE